MEITGVFERNAVGERKCFHGFIRFRLKGARSGHTECALVFYGRKRNPVWLTRATAFSSSRGLDHTGCRFDESRNVRSWQGSFAQGATNSYRSTRKGLPALRYERARKGSRVLRTLLHGSFSESPVGKLSMHIPHVLPWAVLCPFCDGVRDDANGAAAGGRHFNSAGDRCGFVLRS